MLKITDGVHTIEVPTGAYEGIFKRQGYRVVSDGDSAVATNGDSHDGGDNGDDVFVSSMHEKPLSQWSKEEVKRYAAINGINIAGTKNPTEAKQLIKIFMQEHRDA